MSPEQLERAVQTAQCRVVGWQDASNAAHRAVLAALLHSLQDENSTVLWEPSLARSTTRPPDIVLLCPTAGLHVVEVKGIPLEQITGIEPGGQFVIQYAAGTRGRNLALC